MFERQAASGQLPSQARPLGRPGLGFKEF